MQAGNFEANELSARLLMRTCPDADLPKFRQNWVNWLNMSEMIDNTIAEAERMEKQRTASQNQAL